MSGLPRFEQLVFSGGGTRCFWHGGFMAVAREPLALDPARVAGVSGGALSAACYLAGRGHKLLGVMGAAFEEIDANVRLHKIDDRQGVTPHQRIYREVVSETLDAEAIEAIADGPVFEVLLAHPPSSRFPNWSTFPVMLAYELDLAIRSKPHIKWPEALGTEEVLVDARQAARDGRLIDLICNAAVIPPVFNLQRWNRRHVIDGGMSSRCRFRATTRATRCSCSPATTETCRIIRAALTSRPRARRRRTRWTSPAARRSRRPGRPAGATAGDS